MTKVKNKHIGSNFDDFLQEHNLLDECESSAVKRVLSWQSEQGKKESKISKAELARRMHTSRAGVDCLLNPANQAVTLLTMEKAARAVLV